MAEYYKGPMFSNSKKYKLKLLPLKSKAPVKL